MIGSSAGQDLGPNEINPGYVRFQQVLGARLEGLEPHSLFTTSVERGALWSAYLESYPVAERHYHTCNACRHFIERYGDLVTIDDDGRTHSVFWHDGIDDEHAPAARVMRDIVEKARVTGPFYTDYPEWGTAVTGEWRHMAVTPPPQLIHKNKLLSPTQAMAERVEGYGMVCRALADYNPGAVEQAIRLLTGDHLYRGEKVLGVAQWFRKLQTARDGADKKTKENVTWAMVAKAPPGFVNIRSSMIGTLLDDLAAGLDYDEVARRFAKKMNPNQYLRPSAAPSDGALDAAEKLVQKMDLAKSLARRWATVDEVLPHALWAPKAPEGKSDGSVFGHLRKEQHNPTGSLSAPQPITWDKFSRTVLPAADRIEVYARVGGTDTWCALTTAVDQDAPPIVSWDFDRVRNPVAWYVYTSGCPSSRFGIPAGTWNTVRVITPLPCLWNGYKTDRFGRGIFLAVQGAKDTSNQSSALFPEILKSELHPIRAAIEAHSRKVKLTEVPGADVCQGLIKNEKSSWGLDLRVTSGGLTARYVVDRWD